jgi:hypothetical protein
MTDCRCGRTENMNFNYEKLGINVDFSDEEKEKIRVIKNDPNRYITDEKTGMPRPRYVGANAVGVKVQVFSERNRREYFLKHHEKYLKLVRDIWEANNWKIDKYGPAHEHKLYLTKPLQGKDI